MPYLLGKRRGLTTCATAAGQFVVLALDHRQNLRRELRPAAPDDVTYDQMVDFKLAVTRALASTATGILLDPEVGAGQAIADGAVPAGTGLIVALEATGYAGPSTARGSRVLPGWSAAAAKRIGASAAKLLVYYHPEASNAADQEALVAATSAVLRPGEVLLPVIPHVSGGDDVLLSLPAERAWAFTRIYLASFSGRVADTYVEVTPE